MLSRSFLEISRVYSTNLCLRCFGKVARARLKLYVQGVHTGIALATLYIYVLVVNIVVM